MIPVILLKYWREWALIAVSIGLIASCHVRDVAIRDRGIAEERARVADSTINAIRPMLAHTDTMIVHDTVAVRRTVKSVEVLHDTVLKHLTDTALVKVYVTRADSAAKACTELANDCAAFRAYATQTIHALESKVATAPIIKPQRHLASDALKVAIGGVLGYLAHR